MIDVNIKYLLKQTENENNSAKKTWEKNDEEMERNCTQVGKSNLLSSRLSSASYTTYHGDGAVCRTTFGQ